MVHTNGEPTQIKDFNTGSAFWTLTSTDERGTPVDETLGNGVHQITTTDPLTGQITARESGSGGSTTNLQDLTFEWDLNGNLKKRKDINQSNLTEEFFYDALNRLDYSTLNGSTNLDVTLDSIGNITYKSDVGSYTYHATKKHAVTAAGGNSYAYDANGNMTTRNGVTTSWYSYNLPNTISNGAQTSQFWYGANRNRWKQVAVYGGTETTIYVGGLLEKMTVSGGTAYRHYIPAGSTTVLYTRWSTGTNTTHYLTNDHIASTSAITDASGALTVKESFTAYGTRRSATGWSGAPSGGDMTAIANTTRHGYTGHEHLDNLALIHMNGRVYDPVIGRFMSADPFVQAPFNSQSLNRFSYVWNNPLTLTDPSGFATEPGSESPDTVLVRGTRDGGAQLKSEAELARAQQESEARSAAEMNGMQAETERLMQRSAPAERFTRQQGEMQGNQDIPEIAVTSGGEEPQGFVSFFLFNYFVHPWFGWVDCASQNCSGGETAWRFSKGPASVAGGVGASKVVGAVGGEITTERLNITILTLLRLRSGKMGPVPPDFPAIPPPRITQPYFFPRGNPSIPP